MVIHTQDLRPTGDDSLVRSLATTEKIDGDAIATSTATSASGALGLQDDNGTSDDNLLREPLTPRSVDAIDPLLIDHDVLKLSIVDESAISITDVDADDISLSKSSILNLDGPASSESKASLSEPSNTHVDKVSSSINESFKLDILDWNDTDEDITQDLSFNGNMAFADAALTHDFPSGDFSNPFQSFHSNLAINEVREEVRSDFNYEVGSDQLECTSNSPVDGVLNQKSGAVVSASSDIEDDPTEKHAYDHLLESLSQLEVVNRTNTNVHLYNFVVPGTQSPFNSPSSIRWFPDTVPDSPPPSRNLPIERGLRLITSGSSVEGKYITKHDLEREARMQRTRKNRIKGAVVDHRDFKFIEEGDFECLFYLPDIQNVEAMSQSKYMPDGDNDSKELIESENELTIGLLRTEASHRFEPTRYHYQDSDNLSLFGSEICSGGSLRDVYANGFERNFPLSTSNDDKKRLRDYLEIENRDDWIKSLDSAFELDDDLSDELKRVDEYSNIEKELPPSPSPVPSSETIPEEAEEEQEDDDDKETLKSGLFSNTTERVSNFFSQFSSKLMSPSNANLLSSNFFIDTNHNDEENLPTESSIVDESKISLKDGENATHVLDESSSTNPVTGITLQSGPVSTAGTLTANLLQQNESAPVSKTQAHFFENNGIISKATTPAAPITSTTATGVSEVATVESTAKGNMWTINNKFVNPKNANRKKSIKKVFLSALSKDSSKESEKFTPTDPKSSDIPIESNGLRQSWSLLRSKTFNRKRVVSKFSLESGESLKGYAADYVNENDLRLPKSSEIMSNEAEDARRIIETAEVADTNGFIMVSTGRPFSKDSYASNTDDTLSSYLNDKLGIENTTKSVHDYLPTPIPPKRQRSFFSRLNHKHNGYGLIKNRHSFLKLKRSKSDVFDNGFDDSKRSPTIRFAPTPEYFDSLSSEKRLPFTVPVSQRSQSSTLGSLPSILKSKNSISIDDDEPQGKPPPPSSSSRKKVKMEEPTQQVRRASSLFRRSRK